jgi:hypothetical protein
VSRVDSRVADPRQLPVSALATAFGEAREEREVADWVGSPLPVSFDWPGQGDGKVRCQIGGGPGDRPC